VDESARRDKSEPEFELIDTGIFDGNVTRRVRRVREGRAGRHSHPDHGGQSRAGAGDDSSAADVVVSQHLVVG